MFFCTKKEKSNNPPSDNNTLFIGNPILSAGKKFYPVTLRRYSYDLCFDTWRSNYVDKEYFETKEEAEEYIKSEREI